MDATKPTTTCVVTDYLEPDLSWEAEQYAAAGVLFRPLQMRNAGPAELASAAADADVVVVDQAKITREVLEGWKICKLVIRHGDGYDNLDLDAATRLGIACANEPGFWSREVAEQAFVLALSLIRKIPVQREVARAARSGAEAGWDLKRAMPIRRLGALTAGVIGAGKIGRHALKLFRGVVGRVVVYDPYIDDDTIAAAGGLPVSLEELLTESDIVSVHIPATKETVGLFDAPRFDSMKSGAILVNAARGTILDTAAATEAVASGKLSGLALDTTDPEPLPTDHPIHTLDNVIITPHMGWYSEDALSAIRRQIVEDVKGVAAGHLPRTVVNPAVLERPDLRINRTAG